MGAFTLRQSRGGVDLWVKMLSFYAVLRRVSLWSWVGAVVTNVILAWCISRWFSKMEKASPFHSFYGANIMDMEARERTFIFKESLSIVMVAKAYDTSRELWLLAVAPSSIGQNFPQEGGNQSPETLHWPLCHHVNKRKLFSVTIQSWIALQFLKSWSSYNLGLSPGGRPPNLCRVSGTWHGFADLWYSLALLVKIDLRRWQHLSFRPFVFVCLTIKPEFRNATSWSSTG